MSDINNYTATGRLGADAELKSTPTGTTVWECRLAVGYGYGDRAGTNWLRVAMFGKRAESLGKLDIAKGARIGVTGELRVREYDRKDGTKGTSVEVMAHDVALLGSRDEARPATAAKRESFKQDDGFKDDDIPF